MMIQLKVEAYSKPGSFFKFKYLKTELNFNNGTYAIVQLTSYSYRIMIKLSIYGYCEYIWLCFFDKMPRLNLYLKIKRTI